MKFLPIFFLLFSGSLLAQETPEGIIDSFFAVLDDQGTQVALDYLYGSNPWFNTSAEQIINLKNQMSTLDDKSYIGECHGYDLIAEEGLSDRLVLYSYLVRYDRQPIRFTFQFYKPNQEWRMHSFKYDDNLGDELVESARIYSLENRY
ncbi:MAG: hypothetical protein AAGF87_12360 [Bacteroidota bacterium]